MADDLMSGTEGDQDILTLDECVDVLQKEEAVRKKPPACNDGSSVLDILKSKAEQEGLTEEHITQLVKVSTSKKFTDGVVNQIIKCLIPRDEITADCVVDLISKLCANAINTNIQMSFLKWLIMAYEWINDKETVHCLYGMLFLFLDNEALCPYICHFLYLMTQKEDVKPFRIRKLLDLLGKVGQQSYLIGLLSLYKIHAPYLVSVNVPKIKKAFFKRKDTKWLDIVWNVKSASRADKTEEKLSTMGNDPIIGLPPAKRRRKDVIVPSSQGYVQNIGDDLQNKKIKIEQILTFKDFLTHIDKLEFPNQMGSILESRYLQHLLVVSQDEAAVMRLDFWLQQALYEELISAPSGVTSERVTKFLQNLLSFVNFYQKPLSSLESCLTQYLLTWNGVDYQTLIFLLVSHLQIRPFEKLNDLILEPIRKLFFCSSLEFKCQVINCFTEMLLNLARSTLSNSNEEEDKESQSTSATPFSVNDLSTSERGTRKICLVMKELVGFVNKICTVAFQVDSDNILLQHCALCFFEKVSALHCHYPAIKFVHIPLGAIVYRLLFASNPMAVSRLCNIIVNYKEAFESLKKAQEDSADGDVLDGFESLKRFNQYILDISDTIWRNKAFEDRAKSLCYSIPRPVTDYLGVSHINERFSIVNHVAFVCIAKMFLVQTQDKDVKLNPSLIKGKARSVYLEFLNRQNLNGVIRFLNTFIKQRVL
ncbi:centromere protein I-like [Dendronephthya gigantea]|uniref:centromere protein I-like n=1 Tax=Dendronephthya gigantea TaxID=151771 RepID=UPI00106B4764|nr:centromere protein I-like [Dendronephthya gigantea]